ncbi:MAG: 50S ribosomal protein L16 [Treponema sp.]|nr:50S ribosomal protein L16 [Treponema sp.]
MLSPKRVAHRKVQRGRPKGNATRDNYVDFGEVALVAMEPVWLSAKHIEAARVAINRCINRQGQLWTRVFPDKPVSKKPADTRMGKGKGAPEFWAAVIKPGMILFEVGGVDKTLATKAMTLAASKLPIKTKVAFRPTVD